jgi:hypothetical protein
MQHFVVTYFEISFKIPCLKMFDFTLCLNNRKISELKLIGIDYIGIGYFFHCTRIITQLLSPFLIAFLGNCVIMGN